MGNILYSKEGYEVENILTTKYLDEDNNIKYTYTFRLIFPRKILAEVNKHRIISQSAGSSRAIPFNTYRNKVISSGVPLRTSLHNKGMVGKDITPFKNTILSGLSKLQLYFNATIGTCRSYLGEHKEQINRTLEAWSWVEVMATTSSWDNFLHQRLSGASLDIMPLAEGIKYVQDESKKIAKQLNPGEWHMPGVSDIQDKSDVSKLLVSAKRMGRVSYYSFGSKDLTPDVDEKRAILDFLVPKPAHLVPFEHQRCYLPGMQHGFFRNMIPALHIMMYNILHPDVDDYCINLTLPTKYTQWVFNN